MHSSASGHAYLAEKLVSAAAVFQNVSLFMEFERVTTSEDFAVNTQVSLTEISRVDLKELVYHIIQRISIRPPFASLMDSLCSAFPEDTPVLNPIRLIMDPLLSAGRAAEFRALLGSVMSVDLDTAEGRLTVFGFLYRRHKELALREWSVFLSEDSASARQGAMLKKAKLVGLPDVVLKSLERPLSEADLHTMELRLGFKMATNPQLAQRSIRSRERNVQDFLKLLKKVTFN